MVSVSWSATSDAVVVVVVVVGVVGGVVHRRK